MMSSRLARSSGPFLFIIWVLCGMACMATLIIGVPLLVNPYIPLLTWSCDGTVVEQEWNDSLTLNTTCNSTVPLPVNCTLTDILNIGCPQNQINIGNLNTGYILVAIGCFFFIPFALGIAFVIAINVIPYEKPD